MPQPGKPIMPRLELHVQAGAASAHGVYNQRKDLCTLPHVAVWATRAAWAARADGAAGQAARESTHVVAHGLKCSATRLPRRAWEIAVREKSRKGLSDAVVGQTCLDSSPLTRTQASDSLPPVRAPEAPASLPPPPLSHGPVVSERRGRSGGARRRQAPLGQRS